MNNTTETSALQAQTRAALLAQREALLSHLTSREGGDSRVQHAHEVLTQDGDDAKAHDADREVDLALSDQDRQHLLDIQAALDRLATGSYGSCLDCGDPIATERLRVQPQALRCLGCAAKRESRHGTPHRVTL